jgi:hypothetical protein
LGCSSAIACEDKAVKIATAQIQRQAIGSSSQEKIKIGAKFEVPVAPCALKLLGLVRRPWPSAELSSATDWTCLELTASLWGLPAEQPLLAMVPVLQLLFVTAPIVPLISQAHIPVPNVELQVDAGAIRLLGDF